MFSLIVLLRYEPDMGHKRFFLLLNDSSHDSHFPTPQNMEPQVFFRKKIKFFSPRDFQIFASKHGSPDNYSDFFFFLFVFFSSSRSRAMRSSRYNSSKILSNWNEIFQTCSRVNVVVPNTFWVHFGPGVSELEDLKVDKFCHAISGRILKYLKVSHELYFVESKWICKG